MHEIANGAVYSPLRIFFASVGAAQGSLPRSGAGELARVQTSRCRSTRLLPGRSPGPHAPRRVGEIAARIEVFGIDAVTFRQIAWREARVAMRLAQ